MAVMIGPRVDVIETGALVSWVRRIGAVDHEFVIFPDRVEVSRVNWTVIEGINVPQWTRVHCFVRGGE